MRNKLEEFRKEHNLSQSDLSLYVGISAHFISKFEREVSNPWPSAILQIASFFKVDPEEIFPDDWKAYLIRKNKKHGS